MVRIFEIKVIAIILVFTSLISLLNFKGKILTLNYFNDGLKILYLGNMGVLIESESQTILIDGFHKKYKPAYNHPSEETVESLIHGKFPEFTKLELSLVTHKHKDHFNPELTLHFLKENVQSLTIGPAQVKEELEKTENSTEKILEQVKVVGLDNQINTIKHQEILIKSIRCDHTYQTKHKNIQNVAHLIHVNGYKILHIGDTEWDLSKVAFNKLNLVESNIDVAILPFWMLIDEKAKYNVKEYINPEVVIASHINPNDSNQIVKEIHKNFPKAVSLVELNKVVLNIKK
ncbi:MBL fold metallo-hydrolase [Kriegella aquimaris]|uniref:L-ascorbate metabolism protein UlaG, beta-lactamase superfamily n=1 Tax=Kriegella aquimaris TaxID=192904 RepID=A0A1G9YJQ9_9FLAO|nr:MBL fold metallo-hydrolase [Kriegella aquimaris]SDN09469.1 L-ascorbate metabolism protein UlaG, beta-lactamase superfamily [Kriegella aquimaris]